MSTELSAAGVDDPVVDRLAQIGRSPALVISEGALGTVLGVVVLAWPGPTATVLAVLFAIHLLLAGVLQLLAAFSDATRTGRRGLPAVLGTLSILVGLLCLRDPLQTLVVLGLLVGIAWTAGGVIRVVQGIVADRGTTRGWRIVSGVVSFLAGVVVLVYPGASIVVLTAVLGIALIVEGSCLIATGFALRRREPSAPATQAARPAVPVPAVPRTPVQL
jgi:uncharacterized membrane protein HdeD (DUF308 family)